MRVVSIYALGSAYSGVMVTFAVTPVASPITSNQAEPGIGTSCCTPSSTSRYLEERPAQRLVKP